jgi:hypothetical protein
VCVCSLRYPACKGHGRVESSLVVGSFCWFLYIGLKTSRCWKRKVTEHITYSSIFCTSFFLLKHFWFKEEFNEIIQCVRKVAVHSGYGPYIWLSVPKLPLQCAVVWLYSVVKQRLKCNTGKVCDCLIQFLLTVVLSIEERVFYKCTATFRTQICRKCLRIKLNGFRHVQTLVDVTSNSFYKCTATFRTHCLLTIFVSCITATCFDVCTSSSGSPLLFPIQLQN